MLPLRLPPMLVLVATGALPLALIFQLVGIAGTGWFVSPEVGSYGLFRHCNYMHANHTVCTRIPREAPGWFQASQALSILGLLAMVGALGLGMVHFVVQERIISALAAGFSESAAILLATEMAVFVDNFKKWETAQGLHLGYGFVLTFIACLICFVTFVMFGRAAA